MEENKMRDELRKNPMREEDYYNVPRQKEPLFPREILQPIYENWMRETTGDTSRSFFEYLLRQPKPETPSPTGDRDCEELKKEVERLKGLCEEQQKMIGRDTLYIAEMNKKVNQTRIEFEDCDKEREFNYEQWHETIKETESQSKRISELEKGLGDLIFTASKLWDDNKPLQDTDVMKVTHPTIESAKQLLNL